MTEVKKVLQGLTCCERDCADGCEYVNAGCINQLAKDARELIISFRHSADVAGKCVREQKSRIKKLEERLILTGDFALCPETVQNACEIVRARQFANAQKGYYPAAEEDAALIRILSERAKENE